MSISIEKSNFFSMTKIQAPDVIINIYSLPNNTCVLLDRGYILNKFYICFVYSIAPQDCTMYMPSWGVNQDTLDTVFILLTRLRFNPNKPGRCSNNSLIFNSFRMIIHIHWYTCVCSFKCQKYGKGFNSKWKRSKQRSLPLNPFLLLHPPFYNILHIFPNHLSSQMNMGSVHSFCCLKPKAKPEVKYTR